MEINPLIEAARKTGGRLFFTLSVPMDEDGKPPGNAEETPQTSPAAESQQCSHSPNFECVNWHGKIFNFTGSEKSPRRWLAIGKLPPMNRGSPRRK